MVSVLDSGCTQAMARALCCVLGQDTLSAFLHPGV